ncbi:MAG: hypothetical protein WCD81_03805 [Candidatus Bathyarchaeia archaeon]
MSKESQNPSQPPASERVSQQASQPHAIALNGEKQSPNQPVNNKQTQKTEDKENYNGLGRVTTNTPALYTCTPPFCRNRHQNAVLRGED